MRPIRLTTLSCCLALVLAASAAGAAAAPAPASPLAHAAARCGDVSFNTGNIRTRGVSCRTARRVARTWERTNGRRILGFRCRYRDIGYEAGKITCRRGSRWIVFYTGA